MQPTPDQLLQSLDAMKGYLNRVMGGVTVLRRRVYAMEAMGWLAAAGRQPRLPVSFLSQFGEDLLLWDLVGGKLDGFFIECGAFDGYASSVSYAFESIGWKGLLVEALPEAATLCAQRRPGSRVVQSAVSKRGSSGTATFNAVRGEAPLSYLNPTPAQTAMVQQRGGPVEAITVPLTTLDELLAEHWGPIDFAMIDVEGNELDVLDGFDLARFRPRVVVLEENNPAPDSPLVRYMTSHGYHHVAYLWVNHFFARLDDAELMDRVRRNYIY